MHAKALEWKETRPDSTRGKDMDIVFRLGLVINNNGFTIFF